MHAGGAPNGLANTYSLINGRMFVTGSINVVWQLHDVGPDDGGFVVSLQISIVKSDPGRLAECSLDLDGSLGCC